MTSKKLCKLYLPKKQNIDIGDVLTSELGLITYEQLDSYKIRIVRSSTKLGKTYKDMRR